MRRRPPTPTSTSCGSSAWSKATGPSARAAASSIRRRCSRQLGWPADADRLSAARARFHDLLRLAHDACHGLALHARRRRDRAGVAVSRGARRRPACRSSARRRRCRRRGCSCTRRWRTNRSRPTALTGTPLEWLALRASRSPAAGGMFHGDAGHARRASTPSASGAVSRVSVQVLRRPTSSGCPRSATRSPG